MNKTILGSICAISTFVFAVPAFADPILHIWSCKLNEGKTGDQLMEVTKAWLDAAKSMDGGENLELTLEFPIATNTGDGTFNFVLAAPNTQTWGLFMNEYETSPAAEVDQAWSEVATCSDSSIWNSVEIE